MDNSRFLSADVLAVLVEIVDAVRLYKPKTFFGSHAANVIFEHKDRRAARIVAS
jgi:hypothetical protein